MTMWIIEHCGLDVPLHFSAFHPDWKMLDTAATPPSTLTHARRIARGNGLRYVYTGNVHDPDGDTTFCPACQARVIERDWYEILDYRLDHGRCAACGTVIAGVFGAEAGTWGRRRLPVRLHG
jgi:pyruvate formate lyase activating enzyme